MPFVYGLVARWQDEEMAGSATILANYSQKGLDFRPEPCMRRIDRCSKGVTTFAAGPYACSFICRDGLVYGIVSYDNKRRSLCSIVLEQIAAEVDSAGDRDALMSAPENGLQKAFGSKLKNILKDASSDPYGFEKAHEAQQEVYGVKMIMIKNVETVIARGEKLQAIEEKSSKLKEHASKFQKTAGKLRQDLAWQSWKAMLLWILVAVVGIAAIAAAVYYGGGMAMVHEHMNRDSGAVDFDDISSDFS